MGPALRSVLGIALSGAGSALWLLQQKPPDPFELLWKVGGGWSCSMGVEWGTLGYSSAGAIPGSVFCGVAWLPLCQLKNCTAVGTLWVPPQLRGVQAVSPAVQGPGLTKPPVQTR